MTKDYVDFLRTYAYVDSKESEPEIYDEFSFEYLMTGRMTSKYNYSDEYYGCPLYSKYAEEWC